MDGTDILIAGGGIAGMAAAARLAADDWQVTLVDPAPAGTGTDLRTTAFLQPSMATLDRAGVWQSIQAAGAPLATMRLVDAGGAERAVRETADFNSTDAGHEVFGWNVPNMAARGALLDRLRTAPNVSMIHGDSVAAWTPRDDTAIVRLASGRHIAAQLVLGADGRASTLRRLAGIRCQRWDYGQQALVFVVTHPRPHKGVSTEIHRTGGPCTLVPMPDRDGRPCSSVVWMMPGPRAAALNGLEDDALGEALTIETMRLYGPLAVDGPRVVWPIISQVALDLCAPRLALIAEAAHVVPPIGAQGLNMSLSDIESLASLIAGRADPGADALLDRYQAQHLPKTMARVAGIDALNRASRTELQPLRDLRLLGLRALTRIRPLRQAAIRLGLGG